MYQMQRHAREAATMKRLESREQSRGRIFSSDVITSGWFTRATAYHTTQSFCCHTQLQIWLLADVPSSYNCVDTDEQTLIGARSVAIYILSK